LVLLYGVIDGTNGADALPYETDDATETEIYTTGCPDPAG
jgi:hypothetical protein